MQTHTHTHVHHTSAPSSLVTPTTRLEVTSALWLLDDLFFHHVNHLIRNSQVLDGASSNVALWHFPKPVSILQEGNSKMMGMMMKAYTSCSAQIYIYVHAATITTKHKEQKKQIKIKRWVSSAQSEAEQIQFSKNRKIFMLLGFFLKIRITTMKSAKK